MIKSILVCTDGSPHSETAGRYAAELAVTLGARLTGFHALDSRLLEGPFLANVSGWIGAQPYADALGQFRTLMQEHGKTMLAVLDATAKEAGVDIETSQAWGHPASLILEQEVRAELVVMGLRGEHADLNPDMAGSTVDRVIRHTHQPCLLTPAEHRPIRRMLCAYDDSPRSARALQVAIDLALSLAAPLVILSVVENDDHGRAMDNADAAMKLVRAHECAAAFMIAEGPVHEAILDKAAALNCDLVVAGAHGHSRIRELILGSTATYLINHADRPLLLAR